MHFAMIGCFLTLFSVPSINALLHCFLINVLGTGILGIALALRVTFTFLHTLFTLTLSIYHKFLKFIVQLVSL